VKLPSDLIESVFAWATEAAADGRFKNKYSSRGAEKDVELIAASKLSEYAFAQWAGVGYAAVQLDVFEEDYDVIVGDRFVDVKSCVMNYFCLCWPVTKVGKYDRLKLTHLVLVKHELPEFLIGGWITKERFRRERSVAEEGGVPRLDVGTRYMLEENLDPMDTFGPPRRVRPSDSHTDAERAGHPNGFVGYDAEDRFVHYCQCGREAGLGFGVRMAKGQLGTWYCTEHKPVHTSA